MNRRTIRFLIPALLSVATALLLAGCPLSDPAAFLKHGGQAATSSGQVPGQVGPDQIVSTATQLTLQWDPPSTGASGVASYALSYRVHGSSGWIAMASVAASPQPQYTVLRSAIGAGSFDFAVAAVSSDDASSPLHTSLDPTADPSTGWYLTW